MNYRSIITLAICVVHCLFSATCAWTQQLEAGKVHSRSFKGPITGGTIKYNIYLPRGYQETAAEYPVIYHLHGLGQDEFEGNDSLVEALQKAVDSDVAPPMIIVFPNGLANTWYADAKDGSKLAETNIIRELIPHVDATYRTLQSREQRVISGMSMGGFGAIEYAVKFPELFSVCIGYDGAMPTWEQVQSRSSAGELFGGNEDYFNSFSAWHNLDKNRDKIRGRVAFRMLVASLKRYNEPFRDRLKELGIECDYVQTDCPHSINCLVRETGKETFAFMAKHMGTAAPTRASGDSNQ